MESEQYQNGYYSGYLDYARFGGKPKIALSTSKAYSKGYFQGWSDAMLCEDNGLSTPDENMSRRLSPPEWYGPRLITVTSLIVEGEKGTLTYGLRQAHPASLS